MKKALRHIEYYCAIGFPNGFNRLHSHIFDEISLLGQGNITYISDSIMDKVSGRGLIYSKAYQMHNPYVDAKSMYERYQLSVNPDAVSEIIPSFFTSTDSFIIPLSDGEYDELSNYIHILYSVKNQESESENLVVAALYTRIFELYRKNKRPPEKITGTYINEVIYYIEKHFNEKLVAEELAARFFVSRTKLLNDFKKASGMTLSSFCTLTRLKNAKNFLSRGISVTKTAELSGYSSLSHFINTFYSHNHITPLKYQQMMKNNF